MKDIREQIADRRDAVKWCNDEGGAWADLGEKFTEDVDTMEKMLAVVEAVDEILNGYRCQMMSSLPDHLYDRLDCSHERVLGRRTHE